MNWEAYIYLLLHFLHFAECPNFNCYPGPPGQSEGGCPRAIDLVFILDSSGSVQWFNWPKVNINSNRQHRHLTTVVIFVKKLSKLPLIRNHVSKFFSDLGSSALPARLPDRVLIIQSMHKSVQLGLIGTSNIIKLIEPRND